MNMPKRFILQFFFQLLLVSSFIAVLIFIFWVFFGYTLTKLEVNSDLTKADVSSIEGSFSIDKGQITIESDIKKLAKKQDGWIAVLSKDGKLLKTYNTPADFEFTKTDYKLLLSENQSLQQYDYKIWTIREDTKKPLIILFGTENSSKGILETIKKEVNWKKSQLDLSEAVKKNIKNSQGWVQLINVDGSTQDGFMADNQKDHYSVYELLQLTKVENKDSSAYYYEQTGQVLLVGTEKVDYGQIETEMMKAFGSTAFIIFVVSLLLLLAVTIVFGYRFGAPLVTIMNWIGDLGKGVYEDGHYKHSVIMTKKGKLKKKYRIYKELITTLTQLTETLEQNKQARIKASKVRDEWISGLSHDLKTPLASIGGYAEMLQSDQYSWSESEVRTFSATIAEKAQYMKQLLEDLTLTYQLRSDAFPIAKENVEINEQIRRTVIHYVNGPAGKQYQFVFQP